MNINDLFTKLTNFKIKFTTNPSPIEVSNLPIRFIVLRLEGDLHKIVDISLHKNEVVIALK